MEYCLYHYNKYIAAQRLGCWSHGNHLDLCLSLRQSRPHRPSDVPHQHLHITPIPTH